MNTSRPSSRRLRFVRRTSCPLPLEAGIRHRVAIAVWRPGRRLRLGGKRGKRVQALPSGLRSRYIVPMYDGHLVRREHVESVLTCCSNRVLRAVDGADDRAGDGQDVRRTWGERMSTRVGWSVVVHPLFVRRISCPSRACRIRVHLLLESRSPRRVTERATDKMSVVHGANGCRHESADRSWRSSCTTEEISVVRKRVTTSRPIGSPARLRSARCGQAAYAYRPALATLSAPPPAGPTACRLELSSQRLELGPSGSPGRNNGVPASTCSGLPTGIAWLSRSSFRP